MPRAAPLGEPLVVVLRGTRLALRKDEAAWIIVGVEEQTSLAPNGELTVCLVGMPNSGKTTLMNALTGGSFRTGNYPGVTVSLFRGRSRSDIGEVVSIVDLPGIHSTVASSPEEELFRRRDLRETSFSAGRRFRCSLDATQLERHLRFASYVARQGRPMVIALTMVDPLPEWDSR